MATASPRNFGEWIRARRETLGLTQKMLAEGAGLGTRTIQLLESENKASEKNARLLAVPLKITEEQLDEYLACATSGRVPRLPTTATRHNLLGETRSFVGREALLARISTRLWSGKARLLTLVGPFGVGKTELAKRAASRLLSDYTDGVFFVPLDTVTEATSLVSTVLQTLEVVEEADKTPLMTLKDYVRGKHMLLILDNFEQLLAAATLVRELMGVERSLNIIVTSRQKLNLDGEEVIEVPPLKVPERDAPITRDDIHKYSAMQLFTELAGDAVPVTDATARTIAEICWRLDGLPLTIELTAGWATQMPLDSLLVQLNNPLGLLTGGPGNRPLRQQTLESAIDWSYKLLNPNEELVSNEQRVFRRFAVFENGCSWEAAQIVCSADDIQPPDVVTALRKLLDVHLLAKRHSEGDLGLRMLETVRKYADKQLGLSGEKDRTRQGHVRYYIDFVQSHESDFALIRHERGNITAALEYYLEQIDL